MKAFELETVIRFDEETDKASVYTASKRVKDKLVKAGLEPLKQSNSTGWFFEIESYQIILKPTRTPPIRLGARKVTSDTKKAKQVAPKLPKS